MNQLKKKALYYALTILLTLTLALGVMSANAFAYEDIDEPSRYCDDMDFFGMIDGVISKESFNYSTKSEKSFKLTQIPRYYNTNTNLQNTCANVAGANVIAFYTAYAKNLMDGYASASTFPILRYYSMNSNPKQQSVIDELYNKMQNSTSGATEQEFLTGLNSYVTQRNYKMTYNDYDKTDFTEMEAVLRNKQIFVAFLRNYNFVTAFTDSGNNISYTRNDIKSNHIVLVSGFMNTKYYDASGRLVKELITYEIADGFTSDPCKVIIDNTVNVDKLKRIVIS